MRKNLYPGYDVLAKRDTPSWNAKTREVIDARLRLGPHTRRFLTEAEWATLRAICDRIVPQPSERPDNVCVPALVDHKLATKSLDGFRHAELPEQGEAWRRGLAAFEAEAHAAYGAPFSDLGAWAQDGLLKAAEAGTLAHAAWGGMPPKLFFGQRVIPDVVKAYYEHPTAWSEIGWGGPAGPRGYVRMDFDRRDPWEAAEAKPGREAEAEAQNRRVGR